MDADTLGIYDANAVQYCEEWLGQPTPADMQRLWKQFFELGAASADIGSGSGRDVDWLNRHGYPCVGYDASSGLLSEARKRFPKWRFEQAALPLLEGLDASSYHNVVCETVLMHLPVGEVPAAVRSLLRLLVPGGTLYLSWRVSEGMDTRDAAGRLYTAFPTGAARDETAGHALLHESEQISESSGRRVHRLVVRRAR
jgi:SAM-dependent methyltransferase